MKKLIFAHLFTVFFLISCKKDTIDKLNPNLGNLNVGDLKIKVIDQSQRAIQGATIIVGGLSTVTDSNGEALFKGLNVSEYTVYVSKQFYSTNSKKIDVVKGQVTSMEFILHAVDNTPLKMLKFEGILGNDDKGITDSIYMQFNKSVTVVGIKSNWEFCLSSINFSQKQNNTGIQFSFGCAELGGKYPFTITVRDTLGNILTENIEVPFYNSKLDVKGLITKILLINEDKELLISTFNPSRILRYSIESNTIIQTYDMSAIMAPMNMVYNPYNDKIYLMGNSNPNAIYRYTSINKPDVYTLDYHTGQISLVFTVVPDEKDHPQYPANIPYSIGFTKTGLGIVSLRANGSSALRFKIIDSAKDHNIYAYPQHENSPINEFIYFGSGIDMNFDQSKLFLTPPYGARDYGIFDGKTGRISILHPSSFTRSSQMVPHRKKETFYFRQLYDQFIMDLNGNMSKISYLDTRAGGRADFSYRKNENNIIYVCEAQSFIGDPNDFSVLDYNTGNTLKKCELIDGLWEFSTTLDGKYGVAYKQNSDVSSNVYTFLTDTFYSHVK